MKRLLTLLPALCAAVVIAGCEGLGEGSAKPGSMDGFDENSAESVKVSLNNTRTTLLGMGVELDPHFLSQNVTRNDGAKPEDWDEIVVERCKMMRIERYRVMVLPHWWERENDDDDPSNYNWDAFSFNNREMESLYAVLELAQETGADVTLVLWGCQINASNLKEGWLGRHFLADDGENWVTGTCDVQEFAENFTALLKHLVEVKGYTCVKEITPYNEPDGNVTAFSEYVKVCNALSARLTREGLDTRINLNLSDNIDSDFGWLSNTAAYLGGLAGVMNSHTYIFGYETPNSTVTAWERRNADKAAEAGVPHLVGEFGSNQCVGASRQRDINLYKRGVLMARHVANFLNAGAAGASYWSLLDQYYGKNESYAQMQQLGLWRYMQQAYIDKDDLGNLRGNYACRPQYYSYSLITRFIRKGSTVYPMNMGDEFIAGTAIRSEDGKWTYLIANNSDSAHSWRITNTHDGGMENCRIYLYQEGSLPRSGKMIEPSGILKSRNGAFEVCTPAQSVLVFTQLQ